MSKYTWLYILLLTCNAPEVFSQKKLLKNIHVLVYTKNGKGYVHDNIPYAVAAIKEIAKKEKLKVTVSEDPTVFTQEYLKQFNLLIFPSTNNDVFDNDQQRLEFRRYIEAGGGFVGLHSVTGTERNWEWFKMFIGCTFSWHAPFQQFSVRTTNPDHPSMKNMPLIWIREDECYFGKQLYPVTQVMMAHDLNSLNPANKVDIIKHAGSYTSYYPAVWYNNFQGGHAWITSLGHDKSSYSDPVYINHITQGIKFIASLATKLDYSKVIATHRDDNLTK